MTQGARAVQTSILEKYEHADISVTIVWIRMLPSDTLEAASMAAGALTDSRVRHFFDPERQAGQAIASSLRWDGLPLGIEKMAHPAVGERTGGH